MNNNNIAKDADARPGWEVYYKGVSFRYHIATITDILL